MGNRVNVRLEYVTWSDKDTPVASTTLISNTEYDVNQGKITVPVKITSKLFAYRIFITSATPQAPYQGNMTLLPGRLEVEHFDEGGEGKAYHDSDDNNQGDAGFRGDEAVDIVASSEGKAIGYTTAGEWLEYTVRVEQSGTYDFSALVSSGSDNSSFLVSLDNRTLVDTVKVPNGGSWDLYNTMEVGTVNLTAGEHLLRLTITGSYVNIDWLQFSQHDATGEELFLGENVEDEYAVYDMMGLKLMDITAYNSTEVNEKLNTVASKSGIYLVRSSGGKSYKTLVVK